MTLNELYDNNRFDMFAMAVTHLLDIGFRAASKITDDDISTLKGNALMTVNFIQDLVRLSRDIAIACGDDLVTLIQFCQYKDIFEKRSFNEDIERKNPNYWVKFKVESRYTAPVYAESIKDAIDKAWDLFYDADFGAAEDIECEPIIVSDIDDDIVWEMGKVGW